ncbi:hypothetical protein F4805DRAFT_338377 [Annulohypoxylon moriforme]|nr:hypothetical protein F4805DRAFT_338377 [Annulohypoxylon moriforme]
MFANFITVVVSALAATAVAADAVAPRETYGNWPGKSFAEECTDKSCLAKFSIGGAKDYYKGAPAFSVNCKATENEPWSPCEVVGAKTDGAEIASTFTKTPDQFKLQVTHAWNGENGARFNATGSIEFKKGETSFNMPVQSVTGVL